MRNTSRCCKSIDSDISTLGVSKRVVLKGLDEFGDYWKNRAEKQEKQMEQAQSRLFDRCVFFILGYIGRGEDSRYNLTKQIEKNGGRTVVCICGQVTHVVATHICHSKRSQINQWIENRKLCVVKPEYVSDCISGKCNLQQAWIIP